MNILNVSNYLEQALKFLPVDFAAEGVDFELMPLTDELINKAKEIKSSDLLIDFAADNAISFGGDRLTDNKKALGVIKKLWAHEDMPDINPTVKHQVGEKVLEISGLDDLLMDLLTDEKEGLESNIINGDRTIPDVTLGQLHEDNQLT